MSISLDIRIIHNPHFISLSRLQSIMLPGMDTYRLGQQLYQDKKLSKKVLSCLAQIAVGLSPN